MSSSSVSASLQQRLASSTAELDGTWRQRDEDMTKTSEEKAGLQAALGKTNVDMKHANEELRVALAKGQSAEKDKELLHTVGFDRPV